MSEEWNKVSLAAWEEWKKICAVAGCSSPAKEILATEVYKAFEKKLQTITPKQYLEILEGFVNCYSEAIPDTTTPERIDYDYDYAEASPDDPAETKFENVYESENDNENTSATQTIFVPSAQKKFWANEFDVGVIAAAVPAYASDIHKSYKDFLWSQKEKSQDPPLKVIRGKLLGPLGIINEITERYLRENHHEIWLNHNEFINNERRVNKLEDFNISHISLLDPVGEEDSDLTFEEILAPPSNSPDMLPIQDTDDDLAAAVLSFFKEPQEIAYLLAAANRKLSSKEFLSYVDCTKSTANYNWNNTILPKLQRGGSSLFDLLNSPRIENVLKKLLSQEKSAKPFLSALEKHSNIN